MILARDDFSSSSILVVPNSKQVEVNLLTIASARGTMCHFGYL